MNLAENEFELISPAINMGYQLWNSLSLEPNVKDKQKLVARMGLSFCSRGEKKRKKNSKSDFEFDPKEILKQGKKSIKCYFSSLGSRNGNVNCFLSTAKL